MLLALQFAVHFELLLPWRPVVYLLRQVLKRLEINGRLAQCRLRWRVAAHAAIAGQVDWEDLLGLPARILDPHTA